jgi:hypothetical protein
MDNAPEKNKTHEDYPSNKDQQAVDKNPGEERGKSEKVTNEDLKGKKVDRDMDRESDEPIRQIP